MLPREVGTRWIKTLVLRAKDPNFRKQLIFSAAWSFTVIMSGAFFTVYILSRIGILISGVILLAVLSQVTNIYFFKVWGGIADRFSNKSVLAVSVPMFIFILLLYPFTTMPERYGPRILLLVLWEKKNSMRSWVHKFSFRMPPHVIVFCCWCGFCCRPTKSFVIPFVVLTKVRF